MDDVAFPSPSRGELSTTASVLVLSLATVLVLLPFLDKPFHIDDPLFAWAAQQIQKHPGDFFGFDVNWYGAVAPMHKVTQNPPLACYYLAAAASLVGWDERWLHAAFLLPAIGTVLGTWVLARSLCGRPVLAGLAVICSPVFLVSSTNLMCDVLMTCLWMWSIILWRDGLDRQSQWRLAVGALLAGLAALTKYYGICLIPLLTMFTLVRRRRLSLELLWLLIPIAGMAGYELWTRILYGHGLVTGATDYAKTFRFSKHLHRSVKLVAAAAFTGGCLLALPFLAPRLCRRWWMLPMVIVITIALAVAFHAINPKYLQPKGIRDTTWDVASQAALLCVMGLGIVVLVLSDLRVCWQKWRSIPLDTSLADSLLLLAWIFGTIVFAGIINWSVNGRSVLPLVPAAAILMCRCLDRTSATSSTQSWLSRFPGGHLLSRLWNSLYADPPSPRQWIPLIPALVLTLVVTHADYRLAWAERDAAHKLMSVAHETKSRMWFIGHWGFQYYMEQEGGVALGYLGPSMLPGDLLSLPDNNTLQTIPSPDGCEIVNIFKFEVSRWAHTQSNIRRAGFYSDRWGPLPFTLGEEWFSGRKTSTMEFDAHLDTYHLFRITHELKSDGVMDDA